MKLSSRWLIYPLVLLAIVFLVQQGSLSQQPLNGFELSQPLISADQIFHGGPPKDGIPALDSPIFEAANKAAELRDVDKVLGLVHSGQARAYPIRILNYHELVNDRIANEVVLISYCPLCGTGMAFRREIDSRVYDFGVSGLLYNSDVLMYDRQTQSLWSQILGKAVNGPLKGSALEQLPLEHTRWGEWRRRYPDSLVLSFQTGHSRDYSRTPYEGYSQSASLYFPVANRDERHHPKEKVIGVNFGGEQRVYPFSELEKHFARVAMGNRQQALKSQVGGQVFELHFNKSAQSARITDGEGRALPSLTAYWFAWMAFYPDSEVFQAQAR